MAKHTAKTEVITTIEQRYNAIPLGIGRKGFIAAIEKAGIDERQWSRDKKVRPNSIPVDRLNIYAAIFDCDITELIDTYTKVKPIVQRATLAEKLKIKN